MHPGDIPSLFLLHNKFSCEIMKRDTRLLGVLSFQPAKGIAWSALGYVPRAKEVLVLSYMFHDCRGKVVSSLNIQPPASSVQNIAVNYNR